MTGAHPSIRAALRGFHPTPEQRRVIEYPAAPLAVVAGAGSGKTAVMAARMAQLVVAGAARPSQILGLAFTNKAAEELEERIGLALRELSLPPGEEVSVFTYHGFADRILRDYGAKVGIEPETALLSEAQAYMLLARLLEELAFERLRVTSVGSVIAKARKLAEACANHLRTPEEVVAADADMAAEYEARGQKVHRRLADLMRDRPDICRLVRAYIDRKRELGRLDYGDQIRFAFEVVRARPEVAAALRERWPIVLLDEYQDTNIAQRKMLEAVYPRGSAITVVGDPDQAIYAWRGATLYNILWFPKHFPNADGTPAATHTLQVSFRSGSRILRSANALISEIPAERRGGDKLLLHHPPTGDGEVTCDLVASEAEEARLIASEIGELAGPDGAGLGGAALPYEEVAILCRTRRLFGSLQRELRAAGVPVEVVGLGGLLTVPEVVDLLAHLRLVVAPEDNIAFARVAMGPRWRIHYRDMAALARWAAANTGRLRLALQGPDDAAPEVDPGEERFSLSEALASLDRIEGLSSEAAARLGTLHEELEAMRAEVRGCTLGEGVERVLARSGIEDELAVGVTDIAEAARANLNSFLDRAASFSPLDGEASVAAFLEYLDAARDTEDLEVAQPQQQNSVKLMTIHQAKGLEFDMVFVPGMAHGLFPNTKVTDNPFRSVSEIPYSIREDRDYLPRFDKVMSRFEDELKERAMEEERRLAYVALTRARKALRISAAHWYGERTTPNKLGRFFVELAGAPAGALEEDSEARAPHDAVTVRRYEARPETNPLREEWKARAERWPPSDEELRDGTFAQGWRRAVEEARRDPCTVDRYVEAAGVEPAAFEEARAEIAEQLELVTVPRSPQPAGPALDALSVSSLVQLSRCPKQFYWTVVRPLPRRPSGAARLGHEVHRWIEIRSIGQQRLDDPEEAPDMSPEEVAGATGIGVGPPRGGTLKDVFERSRFARAQPRFVEQPFVLSLGRFLVRGRIDAVYVDERGDWELVDYKTGAEPDRDDATAKLQLGIYALAAQRIWGVDPARLKVTYFYLASGTERSYGAPGLGVREADLVALFEQVERGGFEPIPGPLCRSCDFLRFCAAGRGHVEGAEAMQRA